MLAFNFELFHLHEIEGVRSPRATHDCSDECSHETTGIQKGKVNVVLEITVYIVAYIRVDISHGIQSSI